MQESQESTIVAIHNWLETLVIDLNLCPFAKSELAQKRVRFLVSGATTDEELLEDLRYELVFLKEHPEVETSLLIHPEVLQEFSDYNQFLNYTDGLLQMLSLEGVFQIATFHPEYQFEGTQADDVENYTNRSPYPLLHILRESSLEKAIARYPDTSKIPERNIALVRELGLARMKDALQACFPKS